MLLFQDSFRATTKTIRGTQYVIFSCYSGNETVFDRVETLIKNSLETATVGEITNNNCLDIERD